MNKFFILNGEMERLDSFVKKGYEAFAFQNSIMETVRLYETHPLFLKEHMEHLLQTLQELMLPTPLLFDVERVSRYITRLLNVNKVYKGGICKIVVFSESQLFKTDDLYQQKFAIFIEPLEKLDSTFNIEGYKLGIFPSICMSPPYVHSECSAHNTFQIIANYVQKQYVLDAVCIFNIYNSIIHSTLGDIFYINENIIYTPINPLRSPMAEMTMAYLLKNGFKVKEVSICKEKDLQFVDEIFLLHHIYGVRWVSRVNETVYGFKTSKKIHNLLLKFIEYIANG